MAPLLTSMRLDVDQAMAFDDLKEATVVATLHDWTLDRPLPTLETIGSLPSDLYEALLKAVAGISVDAEENMSATRAPDLTAIDESSDPTGESGSSSDSSQTEPQSTQTPTSSSASSLSSGGVGSLEQ